MEWHLHAALFLLALGYAYLKNSHVRIEVIRESFGTKLKSILGDIRRINICFAIHRINNLFWIRFC